MAPSIHLCVLIHGLWGVPQHLSYLADTLRDHHPDRDDLHILTASANASNKTYDGIDVCAERVAHEIEGTVEELEREGQSVVTRLSIVGYSLGGLIARYTVGLLYSSGLFERIEPVNFTTFATPHLGVRTPKRGWRSELWNVLGAKTLSVSGQQMFLVDRFRDTGRPLLAVLADESSVFVKGLRRFRHRSLYANAVNDRSVPYYTAAASSNDPFVDLEAVDLHYLPDQEDPVVLDPAQPVSSRTSPSQPNSWALLSPQARKVLPMYAVMITLLPIALPTYFVNAAYQTYISTQRVRLHEAGGAGLSPARYRIRLLEDVQPVHDRMYERLAERAGEEYLPTPPPESPSEKSSSFPTLALNDDQFAMIASLDRLRFDKYPVHIQRHRHTHAAIVVRMRKPGFAEGEVVVRHWAREFKV